MLLNHWLRRETFLQNLCIKQMSFSAFHWRDSLFVCQVLSAVFTPHFHCCKLLLSGCLERRKKQQLTFHRGQAERLGICYLETITLTLFSSRFKAACISFQICLIFMMVYIAYLSKNQRRQKLIMFPY